jgi:hypothetical protein
LIAPRAPPVWRNAKLALAQAIAAAWVLAHTMRIGVRRKRKADDPSLSTPQEWEEPDDMPSDLGVVVMRRVMASLCHICDVGLSGPVRVAA